MKHIRYVLSLALLILNPIATSAATLDFFFIASIDFRSGQYAADPPIADFAPFTGNLRVEYDGDPNTLSVISADMTIGGFSYATTAASNVTTFLVNDTAINPAGPQDFLRMGVDGIAGPDLAGLSPVSFEYRFSDFSQTMFSSDMPTVDEFLAMPSFAADMSIRWTDGTDAGRYGGTINLFIGENLTPPSTVPLPSSLGFLAAALGGFGLFRRRNRVQDAISRPVSKTVGFVATPRFDCNGTENP